MYSFKLVGCCYSAQKPLLVPSAALLFVSLHVLMCSALLLWHYLAAVLLFSSRLFPAPRYAPAFAALTEVLLLFPSSLR